MITAEQRLTDFTVYKYVIANLYHITVLMGVVLITLVFYIVCLPLIWFVPVQKLFEPLEDLIDELT